ENVFGNPGASIDKEYVDFPLELIDFPQEHAAALVVEVCHFANALAAGDNLDPVRPLDHNVVEGEVVLDHVGQIELWPHTHKDVNVGQTEVCVEDGDAAPLAGDGDGEVDDDGRLADAALAAGDGNDAGRARPADGGHGYAAGGEQLAHGGAEFFGDFLD